MVLWPFRREGNGRRGSRELELQRARMVEVQLRARGLIDESVLRAMGEVPRHLFVPPECRSAAHADQALPIGYGQTISQPYIVAFMTIALRLEPGQRVLEVGTGSGYQAAVLAACGTRVFSIERIPQLHQRARSNLAAAGYLDRVHLRLGDGSRGWPERAPFDRMLLTAAAESLPPALVSQLAPDGVLVAPVGDPYLQTICRYLRREGELVEETLEGARFVPLIRETPEEAPGRREMEEEAGRAGREEQREGGEEGAGS
ncbi:MAG: protein-L-isoaspartate(D-aspartate) O-methyltransferase [Gemmatimonadota bacterium]